MIIVVVLYSSVISFNNSSITIDVFGSSPELGSSQNKYFGLFTIARAIATLFAFLRKFQKDIYYWHFKLYSTYNVGNSLFLSLKVKFVNISSGNIIFSSTVIESKEHFPGIQCLFPNEDFVFLHDSF